LGEMGPITREIQATFFKAVRGQDARYTEWLTPIDGTAPKSAQAQAR
jgi:hypothetical protein